MMQAEVAITNFVTTMDVAAQASKLMQCVADGPGYAGSSPTLGPTKTSSITVDGGQGRPGRRRYHNRRQFTQRQR